jgi:hypothetical protein
MFTGGRLECCDHESEEEGKTVGNNVRGWWKRQNKKLEQGNLKHITRDCLRKREEQKEMTKRKLNSFNRRLSMPKLLKHSSP